MKYLPLFTALSFATIHHVAQAIPTKRNDGPTDIEILNFALTLEHLETAFYKEGLGKHSKNDFTKAGFEPFVRGRFSEIYDHEKTHVDFLSKAILAAGGDPVKPCAYIHGNGDTRSFVHTSAVLEGVGASAYTGAAEFLSNKAYLAPAASILATEARHAAWVHSAAEKLNPWGSAFETSLSMNHVYTIASTMIESCPESNAANLPSTLHAFPLLSVPTDSHPGKEIQVKYDNAQENQWAVFVSGLRSIFVPVGKGQKVTVPRDLSGLVYVIITNSDTKVDDSTTVAGPGIMMVDFDSNGKVV